MSALAFDTYKAVTALKQAGFDETQAEAVVNTMGDALGGNVATKADLTEVRTDLKADIEQLRLTTKADIEQLRVATKADLAESRTDMAEQFAALYKQLWLMAVGIVGFTTGLTVALVKLLP